MSTLVLLRHGQASFGQAEYDKLSPLGHAQARETGRYLASTGVQFDQILAGPRQRHLQTAAAAAAVLPLAPAMREAAGLDEFAEGHVLEGSARARQQAAGHPWPDDPQARLGHYLVEISRWAAGEVEIRGCVPSAEFHARVSAWLRELAAEPGAGKRVLAVTSAGTIAAAVCAALDLPGARLFDLIRSIRNASITEIVFDRSGFGLLSFNGVAHLPPALGSFL